jgi:cyclopropane fatty-acyl-phospholipid synthase-like methyltransferase
MRRLFYQTSYLFKKVPWDTGITPPEIVTLIEEEKLSPGCSLDLGCGTGTNVIYLAKNGWQATGVDFIARPIRQARWKARVAGVAGSTKFLVGDVSQLEALDLSGPFDLTVDIGCGHSLNLAQRTNYIKGVAELMRSGGVMMVYWFCGLSNCDPEQVVESFSPYFQLVWKVVGEDTSVQNSSAWYRFKRIG